MSYLNYMCDETLYEVYYNLVQLQAMVMLKERGYDILGAVFGWTQEDGGTLFMEGAIEAVFGVTGQVQRLCWEDIAIEYPGLEENFEDDILCQVTIPCTKASKVFADVLNADKVENYFYHVSVVETEVGPAYRILMDGYFGEYEPAEFALLLDKLYTIGGEPDGRVDIQSS